MSTAPSQTVVFTIDHESYGVDLLQVSEILRPRAIRPLAWPDKEIMGLVEVRGREIPVMDIKSRLRHESPVVTSPSPSNRILVVKTDVGPVGMLVDAVTDVVTVAEVEQGQVGFVRGYAVIDDQRVTLLDSAQALEA